MDDSFTILEHDLSLYDCYSLTLNSSCDFDTFVRIRYECFLSAQRSYT